MSYPLSTRRPSRATLTCRLVVLVEVFVAPLPPFLPGIRVFNSLKFLKSFLVFSAGQLSQVVLMYRPVLPPFFVGPLLQAPWFDCTPRV